MTIEEVWSHAGDGIINDELGHLVAISCDPTGAVGGSIVGIGGAGADDIDQVLVGIGFKQIGVHRGADLIVVNVSTKILGVFTILDTEIVIGSKTSRSGKLTGGRLAVDIDLVGGSGVTGAEHDSLDVLDRTGQINLLQNLGADECAGVDGSIGTHDAEVSDLQDAAAGHAIGSGGSSGGDAVIDGGPGFAGGCRSRDVNGSGFKCTGNSRCCCR